MTLMYDSGMIPLGEIKCLSLGMKRLILIRDKWTVLWLTVSRATHRLHYVMFTVQNCPHFISIFMQFYIAGWWEYPFY